MYSLCYYHHQIGSISFCHCCCRHIFPWLCDWEVCCITFCHLLHLRSGKPRFCFHYYCAVFDECKESDTCSLADSIILFVHYTISLSSSCKLTCRHWTYEMPVRYVLSSVWLRLSIFSQLYIIHLSLSISPVITKRIHILCLIFIIISVVWTAILWLWIGHEIMVCAVCPSIFLKCTYVWKGKHFIHSRTTMLCIWVQYVLQMWSP